MKKKKKGVKIAVKDVQFPVFGNFIRVVRTTDIGEAMQHFKETREEEVPSNARGITWHINDDIWVFLPWKRSPKTDAHEAYHAIRYMLEYAGAKLDSEVVAYHLGHLVEAMQPDKPKKKVDKKKKKK